jgi:spore germination cell wall hydrolase CwlJ-like protein
MIETFFCLALNVYFEARNQSLEGQLAVAQVVVNRTIDDEYPNTPCEVVYDARTYSSGFPKRHQCQFSWYCDGKSDEPTDKAAFERAMQIIVYLMKSDVSDITNGATHYHTLQVLPSWAEGENPTAIIGNHIFYRLKSRY